LGERNTTTWRIADDCFSTFTPFCCTSDGNEGIARCTRFWTLTVLVSGSVPTANDTVRL
jgi:hypothetical protein